MGKGGTVLGLIGMILGAGGLWICIYSVEWSKYPPISV